MNEQDIKEVEDYYKKELSKFLAILSQYNGSISREYVKEKIGMILRGNSIGLHTSLQHKFEEIYNKYKENAR